MRKTIATLVSTAWFAGACGGDDGGTNPFEPKPECQGAAVVAYQGSQPQVISKLSIGAREDGFDFDGDGEDPYVSGGDCNDKDPAVPAAAEVGSNRIDDDCDGLADEDAQNNPSNNNQDQDGDGQSLAAGDCDDTNSAV